MSVIASDAAAPDAPITSETIAEYNKGVEAGLSGEPANPAPEAEPAAIEQPDEPLVSDDADKGENGAKKTDAPAEEGKEAKPAAEGAEAEDEGEEAAVENAGEETSIQFAKEDTPEIFKGKRDAILEKYDLTKAPEVTSLIEHLESRVAAQDEVLNEIEAVANKDSLLKLGGAMNHLFADSDVDPTTGAIKVNAEPLVNLLRTDYKDEFRPIAEEVFASPSGKYQGATLFEELMIDTFGSDKATKMIHFGRTDAPLPVVPSMLQLPSGIREEAKEAYWKMPESERFEIDGLATDIALLQREFKDPETSDWRKEEIGEILADKRGKLEGKVSIIDDMQRGIDATKAQQQVAIRQRAEADLRFRNSVNTKHNDEIFELADTFAKDLAPRLTYADTDTQLPQARNILARVYNALDFQINDDGSFTDKPIADFYAKQLAEEGVKGDFVKARDLLKSLYKANEKLEALESRKASPQHIERAKKEKSRIMFNLKIEQQQFLGQISTKYVKSNGTALNKQIEAVTAKKQAVRQIVPGKADTSTKPRPIKDEIADYNRSIAAKNGDELYNAHAGN